MHILQDDEELLLNIIVQQLLRRVGLNAIQNINQLLNELKSRSTFK